MYDSDSDSGFEIATQEPGIAEAFWNTSVKANETDVTDYEKERLERIAINQQRLNILGLSSTKEKRDAPRTEKKSAPRETPPRRSSRLQAPNGVEAEKRSEGEGRGQELEVSEELLGIDEFSEKTEKAQAQANTKANAKKANTKAKASTKKANTKTNARRPELRPVGEQEQPRMSCHHCRQKSSSAKSTSCVNYKPDSPDCRLHQFCERCLPKHYGEDLWEVNKLSSWKCPCCRNICKCSVCRRNEGKPPKRLRTTKYGEQGRPAKKARNNSSSIEDVTKQDPQEKKEMALRKYLAGDKPDLQGLSVPRKKRLSGLVALYVVHEELNVGTWISEGSVKGYSDLYQVYENSRADSTDLNRIGAQTHERC